eukprot:1904224-Pyramimonas_sp.AAC.1
MSSISSSPSSSTSSMALRGTKQPKVFASVCRFKERPGSDLQVVGLLGRARSGRASAGLPGPDGGRPVHQVASISPLGCQQLGRRPPSGLLPL